MKATLHGSASCCWCAKHLALVDGQYWCQTEACRILQAEHAVASKPSKGVTKWLYVPTPKQVEFDRCPAKYVLYGGAAGPGKSHAARWALYRRCLSQPGYEAVLLRRTFPELEKTHLRRMAVEAPLIGANFVESKRLMTFPNGSLIECGHMDDEAGLAKWLSTEYHAMVPDEGSTFDPDRLLELSTRARRMSPNGLEKGKFWVVSNPGGPASSTLLDFFIDHQPDYDRYPKLKDKYQPEQWAYVPGTLDDNPYLDPDYDSDLAVLSPWRYDQLRHGNWRVFSGQFFSQWRDDVHVRALDVSPDAFWFRSLDWGRNQPGCVLWWVVLTDHQLYIRKDWKFQGMSEQEVGAQVKRIDEELGLKKVSYTAADPSIFNKTGATHVEAKFVGQSIGESLNHYKLKCIKADHDRFNGWGRCHAILRPAPDGIPWLRVHPDCRYLIRSIAGAVSDKNNPDDVDTKTDDHALDCFPAETLIATEDGARQIASIRVHDRVWTRAELRRVMAVFSIGERPTYTLSMSNGQTLTGTENHPIWIEGKGWTRLSECRYGDMLRPCTRTTSDIALDASGDNCAAQSRRDGTSITETGIRRTMPSTIWNACRQRIMHAFTRSRDGLGAVKTVVGQWRQRVSSGFARMRASLDGADANDWMLSTSYVTVAANHSPRTVTMSNDFALGNAETVTISVNDGNVYAVIAGAATMLKADHGGVLLHVENVQPGPRVEVFNLQVEGEEEYFAAGILVHNCWRYGAMSRPHPLTATSAKKRHAPGTMGELRESAGSRYGGLGSESVRVA